MEKLRNLFFDNNSFDSLYSLEEEFDYKLKLLIDEYETDDIDVLYLCYKNELETNHINKCFNRLYEDIEISNNDFDVDDDDLPSDIEDDPDLKIRIIKDIKLTKVKNYEIEEFMMERRIKIKGFIRDISIIAGLVFHERKRTA